MYVKMRPDVDIICFLRKSNGFFGCDETNDFYGFDGFIALNQK